MVLLDSRFWFLIYLPQVFRGYSFVSSSWLVGFLQDFLGFGGVSSVFLRGSEGIFAISDLLSDIGDPFLESMKYRAF